VQRPRRQLMPFELSAGSESFENAYAALLTDSGNGVRLLEKGSSLYAFESVRPLE